MARIPDYLTSDTAKQFYSDAVRHGLIGLAGILVARGYLHQGDVSNFVAAGMSVAIVWFWQIWENTSQAKATAQLKETVAGAHATILAMTTPQTPPPPPPKK